jgi:hypothetical protein
VEIGIDGEAMLLDPPIRFRILPGALRVRIPPHAPGYSPAAAAPTPGWSTITALLQVAVGHPVAIYGVTGRRPGRRVRRSSARSHLSWVVIAGPARGKTGTGRDRR